MARTARSGDGSLVVFGSMANKINSLVDRKMTRLLYEASQAGVEIDLEALRELDAIAEALLERETLGREEIEAIMSGNDLPPSAIVRPI